MLRLVYLDSNSIIKNYKDIEEVKEFIEDTNYELLRFVINNPGFLEFGEPTTYSDTNLPILNQVYYQFNDNYNKYFKPINYVRSNNTRTDTLGLYVNVICFEVGINVDCLELRNGYVSVSDFKRDIKLKWIEGVDNFPKDKLDKLLKWT